MSSKPQRRDVLAAVLATGIPALIARQASSAEPALNPVNKDACIAACNQCLLACQTLLGDRLAVAMYSTSGRWLGDRVGRGFLLMPHLDPVLAVGIDVAAPHYARRDV
jgi:hypothetical protein